MVQNRRDFLKMAGFAAGALLPATKLLAGSKGTKPFGIQLYSIKEDIAKEPKEVLKQLASYGYKQIESFEGSQGIFWGMGPKEFGKYVNDLGMKIISAHCDIEKDFERKAADAASIGMKYLLCPWKGPQKSIDAFKKFADEFNKCGEICKKNGIRFGYHNHDYSFKTIDGQLPQDVMMANTDPALVDFEMDMYWVVTAGMDPIAYMQKHKNRFRLCHIKDRVKNAHDQFDSCVLGTGSIDYPSIVKKAKALGMQYFIVEQEKFDQGTPMECAQKNAVYMKTLSL